MTRPGRWPAALLVALVAVGGAIGTSGRYAADVLVPAADGWPWPTLLVNVTGSFVLGLLLAGLSRGRSGPAADRVRLGVGTGVLGGFTTYSSFAVETERLLADGRAATALAYVAASLLLGLAAAGAGLALLRPRGTA